MKKEQRLRHSRRHQGQEDTRALPSANAMHADDTSRSNRRRLLQAVTAAGFGGAATLPTHWSRPVVDSVLLPAHAQATPVVSNPACLLTCTRVFTEQVFFGRFDVAVIIRDEIEQCMSQNGEFSSASGSTATNVVTAFSNFTLSTGTASTLFTLSSLTGTDNNHTVFFTSGTENFQRPC